MTIAHIDGFFSERLSVIEASEEARAYVTGVFTRFALTAADDLSKQSVVVAFADAKFTGCFDKFQRVGDWVLWSHTFVGHDEAARVIGQLSYDACHRILMGQWKVYEELAKGLPNITLSARRALGLFPGRV